MDTRWQIELFGGLTVRRNNLEITRFRTRKTAALLAYLAYFPRSHGRDYLTELLWPDATLESGRNNLRLALSSLRRQLEPPGIAPGSVIIANRTSVQLNSRTIISDVQEFESILGQASQVASDEQMHFFEKAIALYRGPLLAGFYEDWIPIEEQRLEDLAVRTGRRLIQLYEAAGHIESALRCAHNLAQATHNEELNAEVERLNIKLRAPNVKPNNVKPNNVKPNSAIAPSPPALAGEPASFGEVVKAAHPDALPPSLTQFFGREAEIEQANRLLFDANIRLLTITGTGGSGKTRLAIEIARHWHEMLSAGTHARICFVSLAEISEPALIAESLALSLGLAPSSSPSLSRVTEALRAHSGPCLLVLDNFEQLVPAGAVVVRQLIEHVPHLTCLITSQRILNVPGEHEMQLSGLLVPPEEHDDPAQLMRFPGAQLFVNRAQARRTDFQITPHNALAVSELLRRLEGLPLAIELCAARSNVLSPRQMLAHLEEGIEFVQNRHSPLDSRQSTLRAAFEWSYGLLAPGLQQALKCLSVFHSGFTLEAAREVCLEQHALASLAFLRDASLVQSEEIAITPDSSEMRFSLLESVRQFAAEKLSPQESAEAKERHALYYLSLAEKIKAAPSQSLPGWQGMLQREQDNFHSAIWWALEAHPGGASRSDIALRFVPALHEYWSAYQPSRGREAIEHVAGRIMEGLEAPPAQQALIVRLAGERALRDGNIERARLWLEEGLILSHAAGDKTGVAASGTGLGLVEMEQHDFSQARRHFNEALAIYRDEGNENSIAWLLRHQGALAQQINDFQAAQSHFEQGLVLFRKLGDDNGSAWILLNLGGLALARGDDEQALLFCDEALNIFRKLGHESGLMWTLHQRGEVARRRGDVKPAHRFLEESLNLARRHEQRLAQFLAFCSLALTSIEEGHLDIACARLREAAALCAQSDDDQSTIVLWEICAILALRQNHFLQAAHLLGAVAAYRTATGAPASLYHHTLQHYETQLRAALGDAQFAVQRKAKNAVSPEEITQLVQKLLLEP